MFERFTDRARRVVVLAQEEARELQHSYIGTEHILLGLIGANDGVAARVLERYEMPIEAVREEVKARVGAGNTPPPSRIPFTPRGKKCLELSLREALALHHKYIGTEHLLLGLMRDTEGQGAQIIKAHAGDLLKVRMAVLDLVSAGGSGRGQRRLLRRLGLDPVAATGDLGQPEVAQLGLLRGEGDEPRTTPSTERSLDEALRLAHGGAVGSHHLLLASLADPDSVVVRTLAGLGVDLEQAKQALRQADVAGTSDEQPEDAGRRHMRIRVSEDKLTVEASDPKILKLGRSALAALGDQAGEPGIIAGEHPISASFSDLWGALTDALVDIRRRAVTIAGGATEAGAAEAGTGTPAGEGEPDAPKTGTDDT